MTRLLIQASIPFYKLTTAELEKMKPDELMKMLKSHGLQENLSDGELASVPVVEILSKLS